MIVLMLRLALVLFVIAAAVASGVVDARAADVCSPTALMGGGIRRPTSPGPFTYGLAREHVLKGERVRVHYVTTGRDAPPTRDSNNDGVPDYAQTIVAAADKALAYYNDPANLDRKTQPFRAPLCDSGGPDDLPDIYVKRMTVPGRAINAVSGAGGAFVLVSNALDKPRGPVYTRYGLVWATVAHELFHLVQYAYVPAGLPRWIAEGTAQAMSFETGLGNVLWLRQLDQFEREWWRQPWRSFYDPGLYCERCYGGLSFWGLASAFSPTSSPAPDRTSEVQDLLNTFAQETTPSVDGTSEYLSVYKRQILDVWKSLPNYTPALESLDPTFFSDIAVSTWCTQMYGSKTVKLWTGSSTPGEVASLVPTADPHVPATVHRILNGFSCNYIRLVVPSDATSIVLSWSFDGPFPPLVEPLVTLETGGQTGSDGSMTFSGSESNSTDTFARGGTYLHSFVVPLTPRDVAGRAVLTISSGLSWDTTYTVLYGAVR